MDAYTPQFIEEMGQKLREEKQRMEQDLADLQPHTELGQGSVDDEAMEVPVDEANQDVIARLKNDLEKINAALARIEAGTFGFDLTTGEPIGEERLRVLPWAETAI